MKLTVFGKCFILATSVSSLGLTIASAIILYSNMGGKYACGPAIYYSVLGLCLWGCFMFVREVLFTLPPVLNGELPKTEPAYIIPSYFLYTWAFIGYFDTLPECRVFFQHTYPDLWNMLEVQVSYFILIMSCTVMFACCGFIIVKEKAPPQPPVQVEGVPGVAGLPNVGECSPV